MGGGMSALNAPLLANCNCLEHLAAADSLGSGSGCHGFRDALGGYGVHMMQA